MKERIDYDKPSKVEVFPSKKSSRIRRRKFIKNRINKNNYGNN